MKLYCRFVGLALCLQVICGLPGYAQRNNSGLSNLAVKEGKLLLDKGDTLNAIGRFEKALSLNPKHAEAQQLLDKIKSVYSGKFESAEGDASEVPASEIKENSESHTHQDQFEQNTIVTKLIEGKEEKKDTINTPKTDESKSSSPWDNVILGSKRGSTSPTPPQQKHAPVFPAFQESPKVDIISIAVQGAQGSLIFGFNHLPKSPLLSMAKENAEAKLNGRWISSIRNYEYGGHEMLSFVVDSVSNSLIIDEKTSDLFEICRSEGYAFMIEDKGISDGKIKISGNIRTVKKTRDEVELFIGSLLSPYLGVYHIGNYAQYLWMKEGDMVDDPIVASHVVSDTISQSREGYVEIGKKMFVRDSTVYDTTYVKKQIIPTSFPINIQFTWELSAAEKLMPGKMHICADLKMEEKEVQLVEVTLPLTFLRLPNAYEPVYFTANGSARKTQLLDERIEGLAKGRENHETDALIASARMLLDYPNADSKEALDWLNEAKTKGDTKSSIVLAEIKERESDLDEAVELLASASSLLDEEAGYQHSLLLLQQGNLTQAYTEAMGSAQAGFARAMQMMAEVYITGILIRKADERRALYWIKQLYEVYNKKNQ